MFVIHKNIKCNSLEIKNEIFGIYCTAAEPQADFFFFFWGGANYHIINTSSLS